MTKEEAANAYAKETDGNFEYAKDWREISSIFIAGAEWAEKHGEVALKLAIAREALKFIDKPTHDEPDDYTRVACMQHRAFNALKEITGNKS